jgi:hypothetical protein
MDYSAILFIVFIAIFVCTAIITLLGIIGRVKIQKGFLNKLFYCLIVELIGAVIGLFYATFLTREVYEYEVWNVYGEVAFEDSNTQDNLHEIVIQTHPPPEPVKSDGKFDLILVAKRQKSGLDFPELKFTHKNYNSNDVTLEEKWKEFNLGYKVLDTGNRRKKIVGLKLLRPQEEYGSGGKYSGTAEPVQE